MPVAVQSALADPARLVPLRLLTKRAAPGAQTACERMPRRCPIAPRRRRLASGLTLAALQRQAFGLCSSAGGGGLGQSFVCGAKKIGALRFVLALTRAAAARPLVSLIVRNRVVKRLLSPDLTGIAPFASLAIGLPFNTISNGSILERSVS